LQAIQHVTSLDKKDGCRFDIVVSGEKGAQRTFSLLTDTDSDCLEWVRKIKELVKKYDSTQHELDIQTRGKFWKNTDAIREARARSSQSWGDSRYLLAEDDLHTQDTDTKTPSSHSVSEVEEAKLEKLAAPIGMAPIQILKLITQGTFGQVNRVKFCYFNRQSFRP